MAKIHQKLTGRSGGTPMAKALTSEPLASRGTVMSSDAFMAKAMAANQAGRLSGAEITEIEAAIARGQQPRAELVEAVALGTPPGLRGEHAATFAKLAANLTGAGAPRVNRANPEAESFMAKAICAQAAGRLNSRQISTAEAHINAGAPVPADIVGAVLQAA